MATRKPPAVINRRRKCTLLLPLAAGMALLFLLVALPSGPAAHVVAFLLLWLLPALVWSSYLPGALVERLTGGAALALLVPAVLTLAASYVPGALSPMLLALIAILALLTPISVQIYSPRSTGIESRQPGWSQQEMIALLLVLVLAAALRLVNLDYKEFQGDEGVIMVRAAQALRGDEMALLQHQKGPVEILLPLLPWGLVGSINESWSRAPFVWAGWLVIPALAALGNRWFGRPAGIVAALLLAIGGFGIAFSRIVQYQSLVMLWTVVSLIYARRYQKAGARVDLVLSVAFLSGGLLAHYDAVLAAPAVGWLLLNRWKQSPSDGRKDALLAIAVGGALVVLFYGPYAASPSFGNTGSYLLDDRLGGSLVSWSLPEVWRMATFYNSTYYVLLLLVLAAASIRVVSDSPVRTAAALFLLAPAIFYTLVVADPRTHIYTVFPALTLLSGAGASFLWRELPARAVRLPTLLVFALVICMSLIYVYLMFVDVTPERQRTWLENRPRYFPTTWSEPPQFGLFGFPHQAGWRLAPSLVDDYPYSSNEEPEITDWYMSHAPRTHCPDFQTFLLASNAQDALPFDTGRLDDLHEQAVITVNGVPSLSVFGDGAAEVRQLEAVEQDLWRTPSQIAPPLRRGEVAVAQTFGGKVRLLGYQLEPQTVSPGHAMNVVLYWQALTPIDRNYQVFVHLYDGTMWAQHDGAPDCAIQPTSGWEPGQVIRDAHHLELAPDTPATEIPLLVGMYELISGDRLLIDRNGDNAIHLTDVPVVRPQP